MDVCQEETEYKWLEAAKVYEQKLKSESPSGILAAESWQKIGFCYDLASRQAKDTDEFKSLRRFGIGAYERAADFFEEANKKKYKGKREYCLAIAEYLRSWLAADSTEKIKILDKCRTVAKKAMKAFKTMENDLCYGQTANLLSKVLYDRMAIASTGIEKNEISQEGIENVNEAISVLSKLDTKDELLLAFSLASIQSWYASNINENEKTREKLANKSLSYADSAIKLSANVKNPYLHARSRWAGVYSDLYFKDDIEISMNYALEMQEKASVIQDNYLQGIASFLLAYVAYLRVECEADPNKRKLITESIVKYSEDSIRHLNLVFQDSFIAECYELIAQTYCDLASDYAINRSEKLFYSQKALNFGKKGLEHAIRSGTPESMLTVLHALGKVYYYRSNLELRKSHKPDLLKKALNYRKQHVETATRTFPSNSWVQGVSQVYVGQIERDLSNIERDEKTKISILRTAIADMEDGVLKCKNWIASCDVPSVVAILARFEDTLGGILVESYPLTTEKANLDRANEVYIDAAESFKKVDLPSRVAESYWKIAINLDGVASHDQAAKNFENAFAAYKVAAKKISQFNDFYIDYAYYMKAWSEIEFAKCAHNTENYEIAMGQYEKASRLLRKSKSWMYLSLNFYAWSLLEQAEDLSRKEESKKAIKAFEKASKFLLESKRVLRVKLEGMDKADEQDFIKRLVQASDIRMEYIQGRIAVEEAKILDKKGEHIKSSEKYDKAAAIFQELSLMDSGQIGIEAKPLTYLCKAWGKMRMADARASPIMYEEAADLFKRAKEYTLKESAGLMAMGHSSLCKALEAGIEFEITRSMSIYEEVTRHLEAAASLYLKAGFETASDYTIATQRLFDAYFFIGRAKRERETKKQVKYYSKAEKVLKNASEYFEKAKFQDKALQANNLLGKVRDEREFALPVSEIFHAPAITSSTASFSALGSIEESAVGLERFEQADIQVKLVQQKTEISVGDEVILKFQIVNVGKEPVSLIRIENLAPPGFQIVDKPNYCQFEDADLTLKGKRLDPLKLNEMAFTLKSFKTGMVEVKPSLVCLDWVGNETTVEPDPVVFNVASAILPGRISTGYADLDNLLFGGIPDNYAVVLVSPSTDERELLIKRFLQVGANNGEITYYITSWVGNVTDLVEDFQSSFFVFVCNPRADVMVKSQPNVFKIGGVERITEINIALVKSFRKLDKSTKRPKRICISIVSDVLLEHRAVMTRKWLSYLLSDLKSRGFTVLAVVNPDMHPREEVHAILGLFDGEIRVSEKEREKGLEKVLRIRKLYNQRYLENEIVLSREKLER